jgi:hypothetical protein
MFGFGGDASDKKALDKRLKQLRKKLQSGDSSSLHETLEEICDIGWKPGAEVALLQSELLACLSRCESRSEEALIYSLRHCGEAALEPLCEVIAGSADGVMVRRAARALAQIQRTTPVIEEVLRSALVRHETEVRVQLFNTLGLIRATEFASWACLFRGCESHELEERRSALHAVAVILSGSTSLDRRPDCDAFRFANTTKCFVWLAKN